MAQITNKSVIKRSICLPKTLDAFVVRQARAKAKPMGRQPNYSEALAEMIVRQRAEGLKQAA